MCGRFTLRRPLNIVAEAFDVESPEKFPQQSLRFNIAPTQNVTLIRQKQDRAPRELVQLAWGFRGYGAGAGPASLLINARSETVASRPTFRDAFKNRRCLIPADGFYEWKKDGRAKQPFLIHFADDRLFAFAGLWNEERPGEPAACTILTTAANDLLRPLHERMPVILPSEHFARWLNPDLCDKDVLLPLLQNQASNGLTMYPVASLVNNTRNDDPRCVELTSAAAKPAGPVQRSLFD